MVTLGESSMALPTPIVLAAAFAAMNLGAFVVGIGKIIQYSDGKEQKTHEPIIRRTPIGDVQLTLGHQRRLRQT